MGLLLGASAVTVFEVLDLIIYNMILKCLEKTSPKNKFPQKINPVDRQRKKISYDKVKKPDF